MSSDSTMRSREAEPPAPAQEGPPADARPLVTLSLLADGQASDLQAQEALALWARDAAAQQRWQTWHLVGDVLRSSDLAPARPCSLRDDGFLAQLQARLGTEPAPQAPPPRFASWASRAARFSAAWWAPRRAPLIAGGGLAALFTVLFLQLGDAGTDSALSSLIVSSPAVAPSDSPSSVSSPAVLASSTSDTGPQAQPLRVSAAPWRTGQASGAEGSATTAQAGPVWQPADARLIRDARLDEYLRAHRSGGPAMPGTAAGRFESVVLER